MKLIEDGPRSAPIWIVGEAPGADEVASGHPFSGPSGYLLNTMLHEAGIERRDCFCTNVCHERPPSYMKNGKWIHNDISQWFCSPTAAKRNGFHTLNGRFVAEPVRVGVQHLHEQLRARSPTLIIAVGNTPLWALAGDMGITKWRGSVLDTEYGKTLVTFHPADVLRTPEHRPLVVQDLRRAYREAQYREVRKPQWNFFIPQTVSDVLEWFQTYAHESDTPLVCDTEGWGRIDCMGFSSDRFNAMCIPFTHPASHEAPHVWSFEDEFAIVQACRTVLCSRNIVFHNALHDIQIIARRWGLIPRLHKDTMVLQHVCFPGLLGGKIDPTTGRVDKKGSSLSLSFIASMYCEYYRYWKDDGRLYDPSLHDERQYWLYNCEDCVRTYECLEALEGVVSSLGLEEQVALEHKLFGPVLKMMFRGLRYDRAAAAAARASLLKSKEDAARWLNTATNTDFNPDSTPQMRALFYDDLRLPLLKNRKTGAPALDDAALSTHARRNPLLRPLISQIQNYRTADTLRSSLDARICDDARFRTALNIAFVETFRFSSNETAFGEGSNLQNIKRVDKD